LIGDAAPTRRPGTGVGPEVASVHPAVDRCGSHVDHD
jgi:hypothetical protein